MYTVFILSRHCGVTIIFFCQDQLNLRRRRYKICYQNNFKMNITY